MILVLVTPLTAEGKIAKTEEEKNSGEYQGRRKKCFGLIELLKR